MKQMRSTQVRRQPAAVAKAFALLMAAPVLAHASDASAQEVAFTEQVQPSAELASAVRNDGLDRIMTSARREHEECLASNPAIACLELLRILSDAQILRLERLGDFDHQLAPSGEVEGETLRTARAFREVVDKGGVYGFDAPIFASAYGNLGKALTHYGQFAEAEEGLRYALQYQIVGTANVPTEEKYNLPEIPEAALALARNLALQGDFENARAFLDAADSFVNTALYFDQPTAEDRVRVAEAQRRYLAVAALIPDVSYVPGAPPSWSVAAAGYEFRTSHSDGMPALIARFERDRVRFLARSGEHAAAIAMVEQQPELLRIDNEIDSLDTRAAVGAAYLALGNRDAALALLEPATESMRYVLSASDPRRIDAQIARGRALAESPQPDAGRAALDFREAAAGARLRIEDSVSIPMLVSTVQRYRAAFEGVMRNIGGSANNPAAAEEIFNSAQWASIGETAATLAQVAAAASRGDGPVAQLLRDREEARAQLIVDAQAIAQDISVPGWFVEDLVYKFYLRNVSSVEVQMASEDIAALDPAYDALVRPRPLDLAATQGLLAADEALVFVSPDDAGTTVFAITDAGIAVHRARLTRSDLSRMVENLRDSLNDDLRYEAGDDDYFDQQLAHDLYAQLLQPVEAALAGKRRLMSVTPGPLSRLPLALLVTGDPRAGDREYLIDRFEVSTLPAVSSLFALRCLLREKAFQPAGCGDTQGRAQAARSGGVDLFAAGSPSLAGAPSEERGIASYSSLFDRELADPAKVMQLAYLPGTKREIDAVSSVFGPDRSRRLVGGSATETAIKTDATLEAARFVLFSTHGLVSSETGLMGEPALVFTPPQPGAQSVLDDGLLTASEVSQLKLGAEFVVLSACNTASPNGGDDADGLSGLAQAFFYAGAQSLLATHWPLSDDSGAEIVSSMFRALADEPGQRRSSAFRDAVLKVRSNSAWSSPAFWAPFVLVGTTD